MKKLEAQVLELKEILKKKPSSPNFFNNSSLTLSKKYRNSRYEEDENISNDTICSEKISDIEYPNTED